MDGARLGGLLGGEPKVVAAGAPILAEALQQQAVRVERVDWRPPPDWAVDALNAVLGDPRHAAANATAVERMLAARPRLVDVRPASEVLGLEKGTFLHAGPPLEWERASGPMRGALVGAMLLEGLASSPEEAERALEAGTATLDSCHHHGAVGPMAGVVSPSMQMFVVEDDQNGRARRSYCSLNEGLGKVLRYGAYGPEVIERLRWMGAVLGPVLRDAVRRHGPVDLTAITAQALQMGDELHNRNRAATSLLVRELAADIITAGAPASDVAEVLRFVNGNDHFYLNLAMAAAKVGADAARGVPGSSMVVAMARNGTDFGIQVSGTGDAGSPARRVCRTGCSWARTGRRTPTPTSATRPSWRPPGWAGSRWRRPRRSCGSWAARCPTRWPPPTGCTRSRWPSTRCSRCRSCRSGAPRRAST